MAVAQGDAGDEVVALRGVVHRRVVDEALPYFIFSMPGAPHTLVDYSQLYKSEDRDCRSWRR